MLWDVNVFLNILNAQHAVHGTKNVNCLPISQQSGLTECGLNAWTHECRASAAEIENGTYLLDWPRTLDLVSNELVKHNNDSG